MNVKSHDRHGEHTPGGFPKIFENSRGHTSVYISSVNKYTRNVNKQRKM